MAFSVPTLSDVSRTVENGFSSAFYGKSGTLRVGVLKVLSRVIAGGCYLPILFCQYIWKNSFIESADVENLVRFGGWYNLPHKTAISARGMIWVAGDNGIVIPADTYVIEPVSGLRFYTTESGTIANGKAKIAAVAEDVGSAYNMDADTVLEFESFTPVGTIAGVSIASMREGASYDVTVDGKDEKWGETVEEYRSRLTYRRQHQPMGGAVSDYKQWALRFSCVTDCAVIPNFPDTNSVMVAIANFANSDGWVSDDDLADVKAYITDDARKPITADVQVIQALPIPFGFTVKLNKSSVSIQNDVNEALKSYLRTFAPNDTITPGIVEKYLNTNGIADCSVTTMSINGTLFSSYTLALGTNNAELVNINQLTVDFV